MKKLTKESKIKIVKLLAILLIIIAVGIGAYLCLKKFNGFEALQEWIKGCGAGAWIVYIVIRIFMQTLLMFVPGLTMGLDVIALALFGAGKGTTYIICLIATFISSFCLDIIGRYGGKKIIIKMVGEEDYEKACKLIQENGATWIPIMYLLPIFPDNAICMVTGASKFNLGIHSLYIVFGRGIGLAFTIFGAAIIPTPESVWDYFEIVTIIGVWCVALVYGARYFDKKILPKIRAKRSRKEENKSNEEI